MGEIAGPVSIQSPLQGAKKAWGYPLIIGKRERKPYRFSSRRVSRVADYADEAH
jgi:hypothetical protein